jgi:hypothetical protein
MKLISLASTILFIILSLNSLAQQSSIIKKTGHIDSAGIFKLLYVPFDVPEGITEISVKQQYNNKGKNVINMGVYDAEGYQPRNTKGFRGWSGGAKNEFFINQGQASTGYIPGKIKPGVWHVLLYPSDIMANGIDWSLEITLARGPVKKPFTIKPAKESVNNIAGWYRGDLHMHTLHSDGKRTEQELVNEAVKKKLDYIISTEHNTNSANLKWGSYDQKDLLIINGEEVTTTAFGHWNAIGLKTNTLIDWRYTPEDNVIKKHIDKVHQDGGLCIINHPFYTKDLSNGFRFDPLLFDGIEIWNGAWDSLDAKALKWWDEFLKRGLHLLAIGASDTHKETGSPNNLGEPSTIVYAESLSQKAILSGLKNRKAYITSNGSIKLQFNAGTATQKASIGQTLKPKANENITVTLDMQPLPGATITLIGEQGTIFTESADKAEHQWALPTLSKKYIRIEVRDAKGQMLALTNPIWLK